MSSYVPEKVYIIHNSSNEKSVEYADICQQTVEYVQMQPELIDWPNGENIDECWERVKHIPIKNRGEFTYTDKLYDVGGSSWTESEYERRAAESVTLAHVYLWDQIAQGTEAVCIVEHDFVFKNNIEMIIPDGFFVGLGYKLQEHRVYKNDFNKREDKAREIVLTKKILGAHGYAITPRTAVRLMDEIKEHGIRGWIDCIYFQGNEAGFTDIHTSMMSPPPGIAWLRESTIWDHSATLNWKCIDSFVKRCASKYSDEKKNEMSRHHFASVRYRRS